MQRSIILDHIQVVYRDDWDGWIPQLLQASQSTAQNSTAFTLDDLMFSKKVKIPISLMRSAPFCEDESVCNKAMIYKRGKFNNRTKFAGH